MLHTVSRGVQVGKNGHCIIYISCTNCKKSRTYMYALQVCVRPAGAVEKHQS